MEIEIHNLLLPGGVKMPQFGLGTFRMTNRSVVEAALECGYRAIDTAYAYGNHAELGEILHDTFKSGKYKREELFITTKLAAKCMTSLELVRRCLKESLAELQLEHVDLFLIHTPCAFQFSETEAFPRDENGRKLYVDHDLVDTWRSMEAMVDEGLARTIGVSNFNLRQLGDIVKAARIPVANHQYECHLLHQEWEMLEYCRAHNISVTAYAPLGNPSRVNRNPSLGPIVLENPVVLNLSDKYKKTPAQILLAFLANLGIAVIPKSDKIKRIEENFQAATLKLSDEDMDKLKAENKDHRYFTYVDHFGGHPQHPYTYEYV